MTNYKGTWKGDYGEILVDGEPLDPRFDLKNHSPTGFSWGYGGSGPSQTALAILAHHLGDDGEALRWYMDFKWALIAGLPNKWVLTSEQIDAVLEVIKEIRGEC